MGEAIQLVVLINGIEMVIGAKIGVEVQKDRCPMAVPKGRSRVRVQIADSHVGVPPEIGSRIKVQIGTGKVVQVGIEGPTGAPRGNVGVVLIRIRDHVVVLIDDAIQAAQIRRKTEMVPRGSVEVTLLLRREGNQVQADEGNLSFHQIMKIWYNCGHHCVQRSRKGRARSGRRRTMGIGGEAVRLRGAGRVVGMRVGVAIGREGVVTRS